MITTDFGDLIAQRMQAEHRALAERWFERLLDLLPVEAREIFPSKSLLDHVPALILEIGAYLRNPEDRAIASSTAIIEKAQELGALRHAQRASLHQLLREYQILGGILVTFVVEEMDRLGVVPSPVASAQVVSRLHHAVGVLSQATVESFVTLYTQTIAEQNERLEQFTRMATHEWRQPLGALEMGLELLRHHVTLDAPQARQAYDTLQRNLRYLADLTQKLERVARMREADNLMVQETPIATVAHEAARQLREMADARDVEIRIADPLPVVTVDVGRLELTFVNLLSNAIKYSDPGKQPRYVEVAAEPSDDETWCRLTVRDNGIGIPPEALDTIFQRFTRAHAERGRLPHIGGIGLGLSIVDDCVRGLGGTIEVDSTEGVGTTFRLTLPSTPPAL